MLDTTTSLASYRRCIERVNSAWPAFLKKRDERLVQHKRHDTAAEKVAENILEDFFTEVLDWSVSDINNQVDYADLLLTRLGIKYLLVEVKRPGSLAWNRRAVEAALDQASRYAAEQKVKCIAVSDGMMLYAANIEHGGLKDRVFLSLESAKPMDALWWLSVHGIYRPREDQEDASPRLLPDAPEETGSEECSSDDALLHPKYKVPARCFAYVGDAGDTPTWKLPYCNLDGSIDVKRLPKAIQAILSNYRGANVSRSSIPEEAIPDVLVRLGCAAYRMGKMPGQSGEAAPVYQQLAEALEQFGRLGEVMDK
ncbi:MAG: hypothetical protein WB392_06315 [Methanotrichaceae archaeon]